MNILKDDAERETTWVGVATVAPDAGSFQEGTGLLGGFGFVTFRNHSFPDGVSDLAEELSKGGTMLTGFEWVSRLEDNGRELTNSDLELIERLDSYPVQFYDIHWYRSE